MLPSSDVVDFRFAAQPLEVAPGRDRVVLATGLGPAFVIAAAGGKTAAERGYEVQQRLNQAGTLLKASRDADIELRNPDTEPALALVGKPDGPCSRSPKRTPPRTTRTGRASRVGEGR